MRSQADMSMIIKIAIFVTILLIGILIMKKPEVFTDLIDSLFTIR